MRIRNVHDLADIILCPKPFGVKFHKKECVDSHCKICKNSEDKIHKIFKEFLNAKGGHGTMKWQVWEQTIICYYERSRVISETFRPLIQNDRFLKTRKSK